MGKPWAEKILKNQLYAGVAVAISHLSRTSSSDIYTAHELFLNPHCSYCIPAVIDTVPNDNLTHILRRVGRDMDRKGYLTPHNSRR
jgi:hypothetical protein